MGVVQKDGEGDRAVASVSERSGKSCSPRNNKGQSGGRSWVQSHGVAMECVSQTSANHGLAVVVRCVKTTWLGLGVVMRTGRRGGWRRGPSEHGQMSRRADEMGK